MKATRVVYQGLRAATQRQGAIPCARSFSSLSSGSALEQEMRHSDGTSLWSNIDALEMGEHEGIWRIRGSGTQTVILDRPKALNALTLPMIRWFTPRLKAWDEDQTTHAIVVRGKGHKAFCAGGDVVAIYKEGQNNGDTSSFFHEEYQLNHMISSLQTPYIAMLNGITMGGGVGLSVHGTYRVACENSMFAMPETGTLRFVSCFLFCMC